MVSGVKAVLFDLFETLITEFSGGVRKVSRAGRDYEQLLGIPTDVFRKGWHDRQTLRMTGAFPNFITVIEDMMLKHNLPYDAVRAEKLYRERIEEKLVAFAEVRTDLLELMAVLKSTGMKLGLISNATEEEVRGWPGSVFARYFDTVVFSYEAGCAKPDARIYELACARLGVTAQQACFVGDGGSRELDGARQAGMRAYQSTWFQSEEISSKIQGYPKLTSPLQLLDELV